MRVGSDRWIFSSQTRCCRYRRWSNRSYRSGWAMSVSRSKQDMWQGDRKVFG